MSELIHFEYPPPRSWEQFEELCADLFEAMWSDHGLVRHGRAGQVQHGVDIVATRGGIYPVGLQCKKKSRWPVKKLSFTEIEHEVDEAEKFNPKLKELYILTTAASDERLQQQVRNMNNAREKQKKFPTVVLFWPEIVRRVARFHQVARKHFPIGGSDNDFSPLLATWYTRNGRIELVDMDWHLAAAEVGEDFHDWPTGRVIIRQRETDAVMAKLQKMEGKPASPQGRAAKIELRRKLRYLREREHRAQETIRMLYTNERLKFYMMDLDETGDDSKEILQAVIEFEVHQGVENTGLEKIRLLPPTPQLLVGTRSSTSIANSDLPINMPPTEYLKILQAEREFPDKFYGNALVKVVSELPASVRRRYAIPAILRRIHRIMDEDNKTAAEMQLAGYFDLDLWKYKH